MLTQKWHTQDHQCEAITYVGGIDSLHAGVYEITHKRFILPYANSSRQSRAAMNEVVSM